jgi:hypothetical protein
MYLNVLSSNLRWRIHRVRPFPEFLQSNIEINAIKQIARKAVKEESENSRKEKRQNLRFEVISRSMLFHQAPFNQKDFFLLTWFSRGYL